MVIAGLKQKIMAIAGIKQNIIVIAGLKQNIIVILQGLNYTIDTHKKTDFVIMTLTRRL